MRYEITAPEPITGVHFGVAFTDGLAWVDAPEDDPTVRALRANNFRVVDRDAPPEPELDELDGADEHLPSDEDTDTSDEERS
jgi:hypothetical protein